MAEDSSGLTLAFTASCFSHLDNSGIKIRTKFLNTQISLTLITYIFPTINLSSSKKVSTKSLSIRCHSNGRFS
ncbi:PH domain-containing protein [Pseudomonas sp. 1 R 17]|uniref:PH domain-containing protein n=1 Tax=Pseudomonas TaxID=286 RepID=UPI0035219AEC